MSMECYRVAWYIHLVLFWNSLFCYHYTESFIYKQDINMNMKQRKVKIPYEGYKLPPSAEQGGQFVDFKKVIERKPVKKVKIKRGI